MIQKFSLFSKFNKPWEEKAFFLGPWRWKLQFHRFSYGRRKNVIKSLKLWILFFIAIIKSHKFQSSFGMMSKILHQKFFTWIDKIGAPEINDRVFKYFLMILVEPGGLRRDFVDDSQQRYQLVFHKVSHKVPSDEATSCMNFVDLSHECKNNIYEISMPERNLLRIFELPIFLAKFNFTHFFWCPIYRNGGPKKKDLSSIINKYDWIFYRYQFVIT